LWASHREGRDRNTGSKSLKLHHTERVGAARKHENVGRSEVSRELGTFYDAEEFHVREPRLEFALLWAVTDQHLGTRQVERSERSQARLHRNTAHIDEDWPREIELGGASRLEKVGVHAAGPHAEARKAAFRQISHQRRRRHHGHGRSGMEAA